MTSRMTAIDPPELNVRHQRMLHRPPSFQGSQNRVGVDGRTPENLVAQSVRAGVQGGWATAPDGRLANTAGADRSLRIRNIRRSPLHVHWNIQDRRRFVVV